MIHDFWNAAFVHSGAGPDAILIATVVVLFFVVRRAESMRGSMRVLKARGGSIGLGGFVMRTPPSSSSVLERCATCPRDRAWHSPRTMHDRAGKRLCDRCAFSYDTRPEGDA